MAHSPLKQTLITVHGTASVFYHATLHPLAPLVTLFLMHILIRSNMLQEECDGDPQKPWVDKIEWGFHNSSGVIAASILHATEANMNTK